LGQSRPSPAGPTLTTHFNPPPVMIPAVTIIALLVIVTAWDGAENPHR
jgi:hypothetical protein